MNKHIHWLWLKCEHLSLDNSELHNSKLFENHWKPKAFVSISWKQIKMIVLTPISINILSLNISYELIKSSN